YKQSPPTWTLYTVRAGGESSPAGGFPAPWELAYSPCGHSLRHREASPSGDTRRDFVCVGVISIASVFF
ncbi:hypothetical protein AB0756_28825, partial [Tolypothrix campylonemoides VB511288_2]